jgi:hypothetical protein
MLLDTNGTGHHAPGTPEEAIEIVEKALRILVAVTVGLIGCLALEQFRVHHGYVPTSAVNGVICVVELGALFTAVFCILLAILWLLRAPRLADLNSQKRAAE